jgi:hypothetical protein
MMILYLFAGITLLLSIWGIMINSNELEQVNTRTGERK